MMNTREVLVKSLEDVCFSETAITMEMRENPDTGIGINMDIVIREVSNDENMIYIDIDEGSFAIDAANVEVDRNANYYECYGNDANVIFVFRF